MACGQILDAGRRRGDGCQAFGRGFRQSHSRRRLGHRQFCIVGELCTSGNFVGVEHRAELVQTARTAAARLNLTRTTFIHDDAFNVDWDEFSGFYFYNPFLEHFIPGTAIDHTVDVTLQNYYECVREVTARLGTRPAGTRVVTHHGYGARMPKGYKLYLKKPCNDGLIELWVKTT